MKKVLAICFPFLLAFGCSSSTDKKQGETPNTPSQTISEQNKNSLERKKKRIAQQIAEQKRKEAELKTKIDTANKDREKLKKQVEKTGKDIKKTQTKIDRSNPKTFPPTL